MLAPWVATITGVKMAANNEAVSAYRPDSEPKWTSDETRFEIYSIWFVSVTFGISCSSYTDCMTGRETCDQAGDSTCICASGWARSSSNTNCDTCKYLMDNHVPTSEFNRSKPHCRPIVEWKPKGCELGAWPTVHPIEFHWTQRSGINPLRQNHVIIGLNACWC
jgi:hypothetical protein